MKKIFAYILFLSIFSIGIFTSDQVFSCGEQCGSEKCSDSQTCCSDINGFYCCDGGCIAESACDYSSDCSDNNECTTDTCNNGGSSSAYCSYSYASGVCTTPGGAAGTCQNGSCVANSICGGKTCLPDNPCDPTKPCQTKVKTYNLNSSTCNCDFNFEYNTASDACGGCPTGQICSGGSCSAQTCSQTDTSCGTPPCANCTALNGCLGGYSDTYKCSVGSCSQITHVCTEACCSLVGTGAQCISGVCKTTGTCVLNEAVGTCTDINGTHNYTCADNYRVSSFACNNDTNLCVSAIVTCPTGQTCNSDTKKCGVAGYALNVTKVNPNNGTVTSNDNKINCGTDCSETYSSAASVTLTATPGSGFTFVGWSGDCSGTNNTCTVNVNVAKTATAAFSSSGDNCGSQCGQICFETKCASTEKCCNENCVAKTECEGKTCIANGGEWCEIAKVCSSGSILKATDESSGKVCCKKGTCASGGTGNGNGITISLKNPFKFDSFQGLVDNLINFVFTIGIVLVPLFYILAGFYFVTAAGEPQKVTTAKNIALYTTVGLGIILFARGLIAVLKSVIGG